MDSSREELPRVSVDTVYDWQRAKSDYTSATLARLEEQILASGLTNHREALLAHINQFIETTFTIAQPNLRINGRNFETLPVDEQDTETFDEALDRHIWSLANNRLHWHSEVAETRRMKPRKLEVSLKELLSRLMDSDKPPIPSDVEEDTVDALWGRYSHLHEAFQKASALGQELSQAIPSQQERSVRVKTVLAEVKSLKP